MILGLFWFLVANAAALLGAAEITRRIRTGQAATDAVVFLLVRIALISTAVLLAGATRVLNATALGILGSVVLAALLASGAHRRVLPLQLPKVGPMLWIVAAVVLVRLLLQAWFFSPHLGDALAYHLPKIGEWVRSSGFSEEMGLHPHVTFPAGFELVECWWTVFLRHDVLIELAGVEFLLLGAVGTYALARSSGLECRWAFVAGLAYSLTPGLHLSATSCLNDAAAAGMVVATLALVAVRAPVTLLIFAAGLGVGIKPTYGFALPGALLLAVLVRREQAAPSAGTAGILLAGAGAVLGSFWYLRNAAWYGNPFHPLGSSGVVNPVAVQLGPQLSSFWRNLSDLLQIRLADNQGAYGANVDHIAGWGAPVFAVGLPALLLALRCHPPLLRLGAAFGASLASCLLFVQNDPWCLKYVFFAPAVLAVAAAWLAEAHPPIRWLTAAAILFSFLTTMLPYDLPSADFRALAAQSWRERSMAAVIEPSVPAPRIGCLGGFAARAYLWYGPDFSREVRYLRPGPGSDLVKELQREGLQYLYAVPGDVEQIAALETAVRSGRLRRLGGHVFVREP